MMFEFVEPRKRRRRVGFWGVFLFLAALYFLGHVVWWLIKEPGPEVIYRYQVPGETQEIRKAG